jgi:hypothetical protein
VGLLGLFALRNLGWVAKGFSAGGAIAVLLAVALASMFAAPQVVVLPLACPGFLPPSPRPARRLLPARDRRRVGRRVGIRRRLFQEGRGHAQGSSASNTTSFSPAWRWWCWPTTPMPSW